MQWIVILIVFGRIGTSANVHREMCWKPVTNLLRKWQTTFERRTLVSAAASALTSPTTRIECCMSFCKAGLIDYGIWRRYLTNLLRELKPFFSSEIDVCVLYLLFFKWYIPVKLMQIKLLNWSNKVCAPRIVTSNESMLYLVGALFGCTYLVQCLPLDTWTLLFCYVGHFLLMTMIMLCVTIVHPTLVVIWQNSFLCIQSCSGFVVEVSPNYLTA